MSTSKPTTLPPWLNWKGLYGRWVQTVSVPWSTSFAPLSVCGSVAAGLAAGQCENGDGGDSQGSYGERSHGGHLLGRSAGGTSAPQRV